MEENGRKWEKGERKRRIISLSLFHFRGGRIREQEVEEGGGRDRYIAGGRRREGGGGEAAKKFFGRNDVESMSDSPPHSRRAERGRKSRCWWRRRRLSPKLFHPGWWQWACLSRRPSSSRKGISSFFSVEMAIEREKVREEVVDGRAGRKSNPFLPEGFSREREGPCAEQVLSQSRVLSFYLRLPG